jgi:hypothetical protein
MFQRNRVILKSRVEVGLGKMSGIARLREKAQVSQFQFRDDLGNSIEQGKISLLLPLGMYEQENDEQQGSHRQNQYSVRFPHNDPDPTLSFPKFLSNQEL